MTDSEIARRHLAAIGVARELGALALDYYSNREKLAVSMKGAQDFLTAADGAVEQRFRERIAEAFPGDGVMGEEAGGENAENLWIIDPIDGTSNFARDNPHWCVSIGFLRKGIPEIGVIFMPVMEELYEAVRGGGARRNGKAIRTSGEKDMGRATIEVGWSARLPYASYIDLLHKVFSSGAQPKRSASGALGMCYAADGRTDAYLELHINSWDVAAGVVIAREAGAVINDFFAGDGLTKGNPILVATPDLAETLADAMALSRSSLLKPA
ncbi:inositol monophosphatase [Terrarubrum flagellatum]|uniref:inositol monophosphatase family protein n=1 Tax=Terrirubrum flagellatum TaxID=2895980 RepID=UPI0031451BB0